MRKKLQELHNKFNNKTVFIVAGGPSIRDIDLSLLDNEMTIAINNSYRILPNATAIFWCDSSWGSKHAHELKSHSCGLRFTAKHHQIVHIKKGLGEAGAIVISRTAEYGFNSDINAVCGNNSGAHAINLAVNMGAKNIILLGYDMKLNEGQSHWHDGHGYPPRMEVYSNLFIPSIISMAKKIKELGIDVNIINCTDNSALKCFKIGNYTDYLTDGVNK